MALYARKLKQHERISIEIQMGSQEDDLPLHRLQIIVLSVAGKRVSEISESVNRSMCASGFIVSTGMDWMGCKAANRQDDHQYSAKSSAAKLLKSPVQIHVCLGCATCVGHCSVYAAI